MYILGIACFYHDSAVALLKDGQLIAAAMEERFSRKKHDNNFPHKAIEFCLNQAGIKGEDLDYAVFYEKLPLVLYLGREAIGNHEIWMSPYGYNE